MGKKGFKERFIDFFDTKGFYIIVGVCLLVIGISIYTIVSTDFSKYDVGNNEQKIKSTEMAKVPEISTKEVAKQDKSATQKSGAKVENQINNKTEENKNESLPEIKKNNITNSIPKKPSVKDNINTGTNRKTSQNKPIGRVTSNANGDDEIEVINPVVFKPIYPVSGKVIRNFSDESLEYSKTLDEWTEHPGIDIQAQNQTDVKACFDGTIIDLGVDPLYGNYVTIDHGDGYISKYYNLKDLKNVQLGEIVRQGQKIGEIGNTANIEYMDPPHLHFELIYNGNNQNPLKFLPQQ